ncbi:MAG: RNase H family protein [Acidimicrobiales bacterium]
MTTQVNIYVDGGCNVQSKPDAWGSVVDENYKCLISEYCFLNPDLSEYFKDVILPCGRRTIVIASFNDVKKQQNNGAELLAMIIGLRICIYKLKQDNTQNIVLKSDSDLMIKYWSKGRINEKTLLSMDPRKKLLIDKLVNLRIDFEMKGGRIEHVSGKLNKADLGYHK